MQFPVLLVATGLFANLAAAGGFTDSCTFPEIDWWSGEFRANCTHRDQTVTRGTIDLDKCIANDNGKMVWRAGGGFSGSCVNCRLAHSQDEHNVWYMCDCKDSNKKWTEPGIQLNDGIWNDDGVMKCDWEK